MVRNWSLALVAAAGSAIAFAGCGDTKRTFITGAPGAPAPVVSATLPVVTSLSHQAALANGTLPGGATIRLQINGLDFVQGAEVRFVAQSGVTFDNTIAGVDSNGGFMTIPATNLEYHDQTRIDIISLPGSPISGNNGRGTVDVRIINPDGSVSTDGTNNNSSTVNQITYFFNEGLQVSNLTQRGVLAGAWNFIYPGQSGIELSATLTNMTTESVNDVRIPARSLNWGGHDPHILDYIVQEPGTSLAVGASTTVHFVAATTNALPAGATTPSLAYEATGATSGLTYTGSGSGGALIAGSTPTVTTRGGNNLLSGATTNAQVGLGGDITIRALDSVAADQSSVTIGAASTAPVITQLHTGITSNQLGPVTIAQLEATGALAIPLTAPFVLVNQTLNLAAGARTWNFTGNHDVIFRNCTIRMVDTAVPAGLTINAQARVQIIGTTANAMSIDLTDRRPNQATPSASGALSVTACNGFPGTFDVLNSVFRTNSVRGFLAAGPSGAQTFQVADIAAADTSSLTIVGSTFNAHGNGMPVHGGAAFPGSGTSATDGSNVLIQTSRAGNVAIDTGTTINTSGGDGLAFTTANGGAAGDVTINSGIESVANRRDVTFDGVANLRGGNALHANAGDGGDFLLQGRVIRIGEATNGRPVLLANGGSNSIVGGLSLAGTTSQNGGRGGQAGAIAITPLQGALTIAAGSGLIAIGGGGDTQLPTAAGGAINLAISQNNEVAPHAAAQNINIHGTLDSSGGWVRVSGTGGTAGAITVAGNTDVTLSSTARALAHGGSPARSGNPTSPVLGGNIGGAGAAVNLSGGGQNDGDIADVATFTLAGIASTRGGHYTLGGGNGGAGGALTLACGGGLQITATGVAVTNGGSAADVGQANGGRAGAITVNSGYITQQGGTPQNDWSSMVIAGTIQANGGNIEKGGTVTRTSGNFSIDGNGSATAVVQWPNHGAQNGDLVTVTNSGVAATNVSRAPVAVIGPHSFSYPTTGGANVGVAQGDVTLIRQIHGHGGSNVVAIGHTNNRLQGLPGTFLDQVTVTGTITARAGKVGGTALGQPGQITIRGNRDPNGNTDGGDVTIAQSANVTAAGHQSLVSILSEDTAAITIAGKLTVENDRPAGEPSVEGNINLAIAANPVGAATITVSSTAELLVDGGFGGAATDGVTVTNNGTGAITLRPAFIRAEDQTVDGNVTLNTGQFSGHGGHIVVTGAGPILHDAGPLHARGTGSVLGHGGRIELRSGAAAGHNLTLNTATAAAEALVDGAGVNGWGGRIHLNTDNELATTVTVSGAYRLSANGSGRGGGGLPAASSLRAAGGGMGVGGIYFTNGQRTVIVNTTNTITARGGDNSAGARNANGTPASGCLGGIIQFGDTTLLNPGQVRALTLDSSLDVSGGANNAGPGGSGGRIIVRYGQSAGDHANIGNVANVTFNADGGASTFPQGIGGPAGSIDLLAHANIAAGTGGNGSGLNIATAASRAFNATLRGGAGTTVGGDGGTFDTGNASTDIAARQAFGNTGTNAVINTAGGAASLGGQNGVVRIRHGNTANAPTTTNLTVTSGTLVIQNLDP